MIYLQSHTKASAIFRFILSFLFLGLVSFQLLSQAQNGLTFEPKDSVAAKLFIDNLTANEKGKIKELKGNTSKEFKEYYKARMEYMNYLHDNESFLFDNTIYPKLNGILENIKKSNPQYKLSNANKVLVGNSLVPNAVCYGNEVLVVYLGLLALCENESQVAFIIAHELSHQILDHSDNSLRARIAHDESKEFLEKSKEYRKAKDYNKSSILAEYQYEYGFKVRSVSRKKEHEADSMAYILLKNTAYNNNEAIRLVRILDICDQEKYKIALNLDSIFDGKKQKFNPEWVKTKDGLNVKQEFNKEIEDSLKTHPDCDSRIAKLMKDFTISPIDTFSVKEEVEFLNNIDFELIKSDILAKRYARALKNTLLQKRLNPSNVELDKLIAICLGDIYMARKEHMIFNYVPRPAEDFNYNYHQILLFIDNIRLSELGNVFEEYCEVNSIAILNSNKDEHWFYLKYLKEAIAQSGEEDKLKEEYKSRFPKGNYFN